MRWHVAALVMGVTSCVPGDSAEPVSPLHFTDVTAASGLEMTITSGRSPATQILEVKGGGLALLDADGDGDLDVFVPNGATLESPNAGPGARLFLNDGEMRFRDATDDFGITYRGWGMGLAVGDLDGNGFDDIVISAYGPDVILRNVDGQRFEQDVLDARDAWSTGVSLGDLDGDGDLDLYVARYLQFDVANPPPRMTFRGVSVFGGPIGLDPEPDVLWLNDGEGRFIDATVASGIGDVPASFGLGALILDVDGDGAQEILVGNDSMANWLFDDEDGDGRFEDRGVSSGLALNGEGAGQATMGIAVGDVDGNGRPDVFSTNFSSDTNTLHVNAGGPFFDDRTGVFGLKAKSQSLVGWATAFVDVDHDGDEDVLVFNGHTYAQATQDTMDSEARQRPLLYERAGERFVLVGADVGGAWLDEAHMDRGAVFGDLDGDGDIDAIVAECHGPLRVLRNDVAPGAWLIVKLDDTRSGSRNRRGLGARVDVRAGDATFTRWIVSGGSYLSASDATAHVGCGAYDDLLDVTVTWPDGAVTTQRDVASGQHLVVTRRE